MKNTLKKYFEIKKGDWGVEITDYDENAPKDVVIPSEFAGREVVSIAKGAFYDKGLTSVVIPNTVKKIGFSSGMVGAFEKNNLTKITIPKSVKFIGENCFKNNKLKEINWGNSVRIIECEAFFKNNLTEITIPNSVQLLSGGVFDEFVDVKNVKEYYFKHLNDMETVVLGYYGNDNIVKIPNKHEFRKIIRINKRAFFGRELKNVIIPESVKIIDNYAFSNNQLKEIIIPKSVQKIGYKAFSNNELINVDIPKGVLYLDKTAFYDNFY